MRLTSVTIVFNDLELALVRLLLDILSLFHGHGKTGNIRNVNLVMGINRLKNHGYLFFN